MVAKVFTRAEKHKLDNKMEIVKLVLPGEAETGNAGEHTVRNSSANVNSRRLVFANLQFYTIYITMPKKTQSIFSFFLIIQAFTTLFTRHDITTIGESYEFK